MWSFKWIFLKPKISTYISGKSLNCVCMGQYRVDKKHCTVLYRERGLERTQTQVTCDVSECWPRGYYITPKFWTAIKISWHRLCSLSNVPDMEHFLCRATIKVSHWPLQWVWHTTGNGCLHPPLKYRLSFIMTSQGTGSHWNGKKIFKAWAAVNHTIYKQMPGAWGKTERWMKGKETWPAPAQSTAGGPQALSRDSGVLRKAGCFGLFSTKCGCFRQGAQCPPHHKEVDLWEWRLVAWGISRVESLLCYSYATIYLKKIHFSRGAFQYICCAKVLDMSVF